MQFIFVLRLNILKLAIRTMKYSTVVVLVGFLVASVSKVESIDWKSPDSTIPINEEEGNRLISLT